MENPSRTPKSSAAESASLPGQWGSSKPTDVAQPASGAGRATADDAERLAKQGAEQVGREAREMKDTACQSASDASAKAREVAGQTAEQMRQQAGRLASQLREKGVAVLDQQKSRAADLIGDCVSATRRAAEKLHAENDHNLAGYTDAIAEGLESTSRYLREQDARKLVDDAADLARRRPEWVLGGAFVVGLAVARFLKASRPDGAAYGSYRYDRPQQFGDGGPDGYRGGFGGQLGDTYGSDPGAGYVGGYSAAGAREYNPTGNSPGDASGQQSGPASGVSGTSSPTTPLDTPGVTTTATGAWTAAGAGGAGGGENAPASGLSDPTRAKTTSINPKADPTQCDNAGGFLT